MGSMGSGTGGSPGKVESFQVCPKQAVHWAPEGEQNQSRWNSGPFPTRVPSRTLRGARENAELALQYEGHRRKPSPGTSGVQRAALWGPWEASHEDHCPRLACGPLPAPSRQKIISKILLPPPKILSSESACAGTQGHTHSPRAAEVQEDPLH